MAISTAVRNKALEQHYASVKAEIEQIEGEIVNYQAKVDELSARLAELKSYQTEYAKTDYDAILRPEPIKVEPVIEDIKV